MSLYEPAKNSDFDIGDGITQPDAVIMETGHVPVSAYTSERRFELERELFGEVWLCVGREEQIAARGDWFVWDVHCRSVSAIIARGKDMKVRAFHNICSHRGMKLAWQRKGRGGRFSCPYHAWTYDTQGNLLNVPDQDCFSYVDKEESGLLPISCDVWAGFIFINLRAEPRQTLAEFLGPLYERLKGAPFDLFPRALTLSQEVVGNWKLGIEAASEGYHVQTLHTRTIGGMLASKQNPHVNFLAWEPLGPHRTATVPGNPEYRLSQKRIVQKFAASNGEQMLVEGGVEGKASRDFLSHPGINRIGTDLFTNDQFGVFPNFSIHVTANGFWTTGYWPITRDRSMWSTTFYYKAPRSLREEFSQHFAGAIQRDIFAEDNSCFQRQQAMLDSGAKPEILLGESEILLRHMAAVFAGIEQKRNGPETLAIAAE